MLYRRAGVILMCVCVDVPTLSREYLPFDRTTHCRRSSARVSAIVSSPHMCTYDYERFVHRACHLYRVETRPQRYLNDNYVQTQFRRAAENII